MIEGGASADALDGGAGSDTLDYASSDAAINASLTTSRASGGHASGDTFVNFENLAGSAFNDRLTGNDLANAITGAGGNDRAERLRRQRHAEGAGAPRADGRASGADAMTGGAGDDTTSTPATR